MMTTSNRLFAMVLTIVLDTCTTLMSAQEADVEALVDDFVHYALIANIDLAEANAIALLRSEMSDEEFYELINATKQKIGRAHV